MINLYNLTTNPEELPGYKQQDDVPELLWDKIRKMHPDLRPASIGVMGAEKRHAITVMNNEYKKHEDVWAKDAGTAYDYAKNILQGRFPAGEAAIKTDPEFAMMYAINILKARWPAAEPYILNGGDPVNIAVYCTNFKIKDWPEGVKVILTDITAISMYARSVINGRWEAGEQAILKLCKTAKNCRDAVVYIGEHLRQYPWPEFEQLLIKIYDYDYSYYDGYSKAQYSVSVRNYLYYVYPDWCRENPIKFNTDNLNKLVAVLRSINAKDSPAAP